MTTHQDHTPEWTKADAERLALLEERLALLEANFGGSGDVTVWRVTRADIDALVGRSLTDEEYERIGRAIDYSTVDQCIEAAVEQVVELYEDHDNR